MAKIKIFLLILIATTTSYFASLKYGFSQDDWYFLSISHANNLGEILNFFNPWSQSGFAFYRPLGTQLYYYLAQTLFGLTSAPYYMHIFMLLVQASNAYLVSVLIKKLTNDSHLGLLVALVYATSSVHFLSLFYIAATQQLLAALFSLLSINDFLERKSWRSALWFFLALLCKEVAIVTPIIMLLSLQRIGKKISFSELARRALPVGIAGMIYLLLRFGGGITSQSEYRMVLNGSVLSTIRWYFLFSYGAAEELVRYGLPRMGLSVTRYLADYGYAGMITLFAPVVLGLFAIIRTVMSLLGKGNLKRLNVSIYFTWWILALAPVLFLQDHRYPHYLDLALIPMVLLVLEGVAKKTQLAVVGLLIVASVFCINLSIRTHWTTKRAVMATSATRKIESGKACQYESWYVVGEGNAPRELSYALSLDNGPKVICNHDLRVYYEGVNTGDLKGAFIFETEGVAGL